MDRNQAIGFVLIAVLFIVYFQFFMDSPAEEQAVSQDTLQTQVIPDTTRTPEETPNVITPANDSLMNEQLVSMFGEFAPIADGEEQLVELSNDKMTDLFDATAFATEEAIINAMVAAETMEMVRDAMRISSYTKSWK